ncbi:unnamed protein product [Medioppia subpectinata]|uniref:G-protein coupled receptors family 1 profile domain-containing protein n=1 Tax=Medioppia subpectinata TaxID=1979941 RepID=A0A7R9Q2A2_9ACAR|nr:unnamed protein product [Medioppia subpectinata]CAG2109208.1 unnamed protein product [Medioppia subpectinata]
MRKQSINIYLTVLALYDNGVLLFGILMLGVPALYLNPTQMITSDEIPVLSSEPSSSSPDILNTNETSLTLSTRSRAIWALSALSVASFVYNLPRFAEIDMSDESVKQSNLRRSKIYYWFYYIFLNLSLIHIIPLSLLSVLNIKIYLSVQMASNNRSELTRARQRELNLASMLTLLVAIFIACNAPAFVINCLELIKPDYLALPTMFSNVLVCLNSTINFLIYCIFGKKFREKLKEVFKCRTRKKIRKSSANRQHYYFGGSCAADTFV